MQDIKEFIFHKNENYDKEIKNITEIIIFTLTTYIVVPTFFESLLRDTYNLTSNDYASAAVQIISQNTSDFRITYLAAICKLILLYVFIKIIDELYSPLFEYKRISDILLVLLLVNLIPSIILLNTIVTHSQPFSDKHIAAFIYQSALINYHIPEYCIQLLLIFSVLYGLKKLLEKVIDQL